MIQPALDNYEAAVVATESQWAIFAAVDSLAAVDSSAACRAQSRQLEAAEVVFLSNRRIARCPMGQIAAAMQQRSAH